MISLLSSVPEFKVLGEAASGEEAVVRAAQLQPDVVLMDLQMPQVNGIEATRRILQESPSVRILVVMLFEDDVSNIFTKLQLLTGHRRSSALGKRGCNRARKHSKLRRQRR
jgi:DNA-binding NarL/FixJ family response regulator